MLLHRLGKASSAINGLAAAALGTCALQHPSSTSPANPRAGPVQDMIVSRMGTAKLLELLDALQEDRYYRAAKAPLSTASRPQDRGSLPDAGAVHIFMQVLASAWGMEKLCAILYLPVATCLAFSFRDSGVKGLFNISPDILDFMDVMQRRPSLHP